MSSYETFHDLWIQIWIDAYEEYREIIPEKGWNRGYQGSELPNGGLGNTLLHSTYTILFPNQNPKSEQETLKPSHKPFAVSKTHEEITPTSILFLIIS